MVSLEGIASGQTSCSTWRACKSLGIVEVGMTFGENPGRKALQGLLSRVVSKIACR
jgi:hypothetical protein